MGSSEHVIFVFLMYSAAMFILPGFTFFAVKNVLEQEFHITGFENTVWSVICAVLVVNIIIVIYVWRAFKDEVQEENEGVESSSIGEGNIPALTKSDLNLKKCD